jgi:hypothetical protein
MPNRRCDGYSVQRKMMRAILTSTLAILLLAGLCARPVQAGWVETHEEGKVVFYSAGQIKAAVPDDPIWWSVDIEDQILLLVHNERRIYSRGSMDDYCHAMETSLRAAMNDMSPEEHALREQLMDKGDRNTDQRPQITIGRSGEGGPIAGLATHKYLVLVDGKLYEELWLAPDTPARKELDPGAIRNVEKRMTICMEHIAEIVTGTWLTQPEQDAVYQDLMTKGWLMRRISYHDGSPLTEMVVASLQREDIPASEFQPPVDFLQVPFEAFIFEE